MITKTSAVRHGRTAVCHFFLHFEMGKMQVAIVTGCLFKSYCLRKNNVASSPYQNIAMGEGYSYESYIV